MASFMEKKLFYYFTRKTEKSDILIYLSFPKGSMSRLSKGILLSTMYCRP